MRNAKLKTVHSTKMLAISSNFLYNTLYWKMHYPWPRCLWKKLESPSLKYALSLIWLKFANRLWRIRKIFFLISTIYFRYFVVISLCKKALPFIWTKLNPLHLKMICAKVGWNWPSGAGKEIHFDFVNLFSPFL